jgi:Predicted UDP-glucose 6-dehydrogenase
VSRIPDRNAAKNIRLAPKTTVVVGTGYVGLSLSALLARRHQVTAVDINGAKVDQINSRLSPIEDVETERFLRDVPLQLTATTDAAASYADANYLVVATPTDYDAVTNYFNTSTVESVADQAIAVNPRVPIVRDCPRFG